MKTVFTFALATILTSVLSALPMQSAKAQYIWGGQEGTTYEEMKQRRAINEMHRKLMSPTTPSYDNNNNSSSPSGFGALGAALASRREAKRFHAASRKFYSGLMVVFGEKKAPEPLGLGHHPPIYELVQSDAPFEERIKDVPLKNIVALLENPVAEQQPAIREILEYALRIKLGIAE